MTYHLSEASIVPQGGHYTRVGRGGRGNFIKPSTSSSSSTNTKKQSSAPPATVAAPAPYPSTTTTTITTPASSSTAARYTTGRGGVGNVHAGERPMFFFDEELERIYSREGGTTAPVIHIGRAGFGNRVNVGGGSGAGSSSSASSSAGSDLADGVDSHQQRASDDTRRFSGEGVWSRLSHTFSRGS